MASIDIFCQQLGIQHPLDQTTCIGYGQKKPTCGLLVAKSSRLQAVRVLDQISQGLDDGFEFSRLRGLASLLLCKRWHQSQAHEHAERWTAKLNNTGTSKHFSRLPTQAPACSSRTYSTRHPSSETEYYEIPPQLSRSVNHSSRPVPQGPASPSNSYQPGLHSCSTEELISEIQKRLGLVADNQLLSAIVSIADGRTQERAPVRSPRANAAVTSNARAVKSPARTGVNLCTTDDSSILRVVHTTAPRQVIRNEARDIPPNNASAVRTLLSSEESPVARSTARPPPTGQDIRQSRIATLALAARSPVPEPQVRPPSHLRSSYIECGVCMEPYGDGDTEQWECRNCQNRAHNDCFESWRTAPSARGVRCMYCRITIPQ